MNIERLQRAVDVLLIVPAEKFDMDMWVQLEDDDFINDANNSWKATTEQLDKNCGTEACAAGWATLVIPELSVKLDFYNRLPCEIIYTEESGYKSYDYDGLAKCFGIKIETAEILFAPYSYYDDHDVCYMISKSRVINRINKLIEIGEDLFLDAMKKP